MASASSASRSVDAAPAASNVSGARAAADVTAITSHDDFLLELGQALGGQAGVRPVETLEAALEALGTAKRAQVLVIDARGLANVRAAVDAVHGKAPRAVTVVFAEGSAEKQLGASLKGSRVFAVLPTPLDARKTQAVLEGAIQEAVSNHASAGTAPAAAADLSISTFRPQAAAAHGASGGERRRPLLLIGSLAAAALALAGGGAWWYFSQGPAARPAPAPAPAAPAAAQEAAPAVAPVTENTLLQGKLDELLEKARLAMHERRFTEPSGDNALLYYRSAAAADANSAEARDGLQRVAGVLASRFEEALTAGHLDEAALNLANFKTAAPGDERTAGFEQHYFSAAISRALSDGNADRAAALLRQATQSSAVPAEQLARWKSEIGRRQDELRLQRLATLAAERTRDGRLVDGEDSAKAYVLQLQAAAAGNAATQRATQELIAAELRKAREAALAKNSAEQERWLTEARAVGAKSADIAAFQRELAGARQKAAQAESERLLQLARERLRDGRLTDPAQDSAAFYLTQVQSADPNNAGLASAGHDFAARLLERARATALGGKPADADLALAQRWGASPQDVAAVQQLQSPQQGASGAPDTAALVAKLKQLRASPPDYPPNALAQRISGSVTLEYTVTIRGDTRDVHIVEATPPGVFDQAAINAVKHWRYAPMIVNGSPVEVPVKTRVRFELPK